MTTSLPLLFLAIAERIEPMRAGLDPISWVVIAVVVAAAAYSAYSASKAAGDAPKGVTSGQSVQDIQSVRTTEGSSMWRFGGLRARVPGTVLWSSDIRAKKHTETTGMVKQVFYTYEVDLHIGWGQAFGGVNGKGKVDKVIAAIFDGKKVWQNGKESKYDDRWDSWENNLGSQTQTAPSILEQEFGSGKVSGNRDTVTSSIDTFQLEDFGNRIPSTMYAILQPDADGYTLADIIRDVWNRNPKNDADADLDVSRVTGKNVLTEDADEEGLYEFPGLQIEGPITVNEIIEHLVTVMDLTVRHSGAKLEFLDRGDEPIVLVDSGHLGCSDGKASNERPLQLSRMDPTTRPSSVTVRYYDKAHRYQRAAERHLVNDAPPGENVVVIDYPGVLREGQARKVAKRRALEPYRIGFEARISGLPPDYITTQAGDIVAAPFEGQVYEVRASEITVGANYLIKVNGVVEQIRTATDDLGDTSTSTLGDVGDDEESLDDGPQQDDIEDDDSDGYDPPLVRKAPMNLPPLFETSEAKDTGMHYAHCAEDPQKKWKGSTPKLSWNEDGPWNNFGGPSAADEQLIGIARTAFPDFELAGTGIDGGSVLKVQMLEGAPTSATRAEVESGANWVAIGDVTTERLEVAAFMDAAAVAPTTTDLTGLGLQVVDANTIAKSSGASFASMGVSVGDYVKVDGFKLGNNVALFRKVTAVNANDFNVDTDDGDLTAEGPLASTVSISLTVNSGVYLLSNWFRGMRDTIDHVADHLAGDLVVFLDRDDLIFKELPQGKLKKKVWFRDVPKGAGVGDVLSLQLRFEGETMRPFRPADFRSQRGPGGGDGWELTFTWVHVTRFPFPDPTTEEIPPHPLNHEGDPESYEMRIYSDAGKTTLVRSFSIDAPDDHDPGDSPQVRSKVYTEAQQLSDGVLGAELWLELWEVGAVVKKGNVSELYVPAAF